MVGQKRREAWLDRPSGFMANIFKTPKHIKRHFKALNRLDPNLEIPQMKAFIVLAAYMLAILVLALYLIANWSEVYYIGIPVLLFAGATTIIAVQVLFSNNGVSYLKLTINLVGFVFMEKKRRKTGAGTTSVGIDDYAEDGMILYSDGDIGYMYKIVGYGSKTMLPQTIDQVRMIQAKYLRVRVPNTTESEIIKISLSNPESQLNNIDTLQKMHIEQGAKEDEDLFHAWANFMLENQKYYINNVVKDKEYVFEQRFIVRAGSKEVLEKQIGNFEKYAEQGMLYSYYKMGRDEVKAFYDEMLLMK